MSYSFIVATAKETTDSANVTTTGIDTSGADLLVVAAADNGAAPTPTDNKSNSWTGLTSYSSANGGRIQLFYSKPTSVGSGHTFTITAGSFPAIAAIAFSGSASSSVFDVENGVGGLLGQSTAQPGSITPGSDNELLITAVCLGGNLGGSTLAVDSSFTKATNGEVKGTSGVSYGVSIAYLIETTATAKNPQWSGAPGATAGYYSANIGSFKASAGGGGFGLKRNASLNGLSTSGPFFSDPLAMLGSFARRASGLLVPVPHPLQVGLGVR
jgi:hypothetical protein